MRTTDDASVSSMKRERAPWKRFSNGFLQAVRAEVGLGIILF